MSINKKVFSKAASTDTFQPTKHFNTVLYKGNGGTQNVGSYINQGGQFNGTSSRIDVSGLNDFFGSKQSFSVSAWVKPEASGNLAIFDDYNFANQNIALYVYDGVFNFFQRYNNSDLSLNSGSTTYYFTYNHVVVTSDQTTAKLYVNGSLVASGSVPAQSYSGGSPQVGIGRQQHPSSSTYAYFNGGLDQIRVFSKAISASEVTTLNGETFDSATKSITDIFGDRSALALYQFENNANDTGGASGYLNEGGIFNGSTSYVEFAADTFQFQTLSISAWIKVDPSGSGNRIIFSNYEFSGVSKGLIFRVGTGNIIHFEGYAADTSGQRFTATTSTTIADETWVNVIGVADSSANTVKIYINGSEASYSTNTYGTDVLFHSGADSYIGALVYSGGSEQFFRGTIDEVRIYNDVLTTTEIGHIANNTTASIPTGNLEAYYKFDGTFQDDQQEYDGVGTNVTFRYDGTASNVNFQGATRFTPDFVWTKMRSSGNNHQLFDSVRGVTKELESNTNAVEVTNADSLTAFNSNGFKVGSSNNENQSGVDYVAWCFNAGSGNAASNTDGTITSTVKVNQDAGFSIVKWTSDGSTGLEVGHGLSSTPEMIIYKRTSSTSNWSVYTDAIDGSWDFLRLNTTDAKSDSSNTAANSSLIRNISTLGNWIAYCFHSITSYQKIGTYTGNNTGDNQNNVIETGFEPAWLLIKNTTSSSNNWIIVDNKRDTTNPRTEVLEPNTSDQEATQTVNVNFLTNGFELTNGNSDVNDNSAVYLYWAIAADPSTASTPVVTNAFDVVRWTGTGSNTDILADTSPDLVWGKRSDNAIGDTNHFWFDSIRGVESRLMSNSTLAETVISDEVTAFNEKGFSVGIDPSTNGSGAEMVAFLWSAGSHEGNLPTLNTDGAVDSTVSVNDAAGFSIIKWTSDGGSTATTKGHGMSAAVDFAIVKSMDSSSIWMIFHKDLPQNKYIQFNTDALSPDGGTTYFTTSTTTLGFRDGSNSSSGDRMIAYAWREISGYSSVGTYTGNSSSTTVTTGFKPRWVMMKRTTAVGNWIIWDSLSNPSADNDNNDVIYANTAGQRSDAGSGRFIAFNSNGFTISGDSGDSNSNGHTYLYFALA